MRYYRTFTMSERFGLIRGTQWQKAVFEKINTLFAYNDRNLQLMNQMVEVIASEMTGRKPQNE